METVIFPNFSLEHHANEKDNLRTHPTPNPACHILEF